ncbi:MAG: hypothetical protein HQK49_08140 [Oligoflexia bacterium]|nr:hypothetical protein [Oligoflexia bacterium]
MSNNHNLNKLTPELTVTSIEQSKDFYINKLGFKIVYERPEDKFCFLSLEGIEFLIQDHDGYLLRFCD